MKLTIARRSRKAPAYGITTADGSHLDDISRRQKQYALTMLFRIVAILVVVLVPGLSLLERVILIFVASVIPYVAVIRANGGPDNTADPTNLMIGGPRQPELTTAERSIGAGQRVDAAEPDEVWSAEDRAGGARNAPGAGGPQASDPTT